MRTGLQFPYPTCRSGRAKAAPVSESGGAGLLVRATVLGVALRRKVVSDRGKDRGKLLQRSLAPEPQYRPRSSWERQERILRSVGEPAPHLTIIAPTQLLQRCTVRPKTIRHENLRSLMPFHRFLNEFQRSLVIARLGDEAFQHLALVIDHPPKVVCHRVNLYENLVKKAPSVLERSHRFHPAAADLRCKKMAEPVTPSG